jgi:hypothetical protein
MQFPRLSLLTSIFNAFLYSHHPAHFANVEDIYSWSNKNRASNDYLVIMFSASIGLVMLAFVFIHYLILFTCPHNKPNYLQELYSKILFWIGTFSLIAFLDVILLCPRRPKLSVVMHGAMNGEGEVLVQRSRSPRTLLVCSRRLLTATLKSLLFLEI